MMRAVSFNFWGLRHRAEDIEARKHAFGAALADLQADVVGMQEVWEESDASYFIARAAMSGLPHAHYYRAGLIGSGLLILSKHPIVAVDFHRFRLQGRPERIQEGDFWAGKGIAFARLRTPEGDLDVFNTHPLAQYFPDEQDLDAPLRASQHYAMARFIAAHKSENPVIALGDYNTCPEQIGYRIMTGLAGLTDSFKAAHPDVSENTPESATYSPQNPYASDKKSYQRIDYIFVRDVQPQAVDIILKELHPADNDGAKAYSDHYGLLLVAERGAGDSKSSSAPEVAQQMLNEVQRMLQSGLEAAEKRQTQQRIRAVLGLLAAGVLFLPREKWRGVWLLPLPFVLFNLWLGWFATPYDIRMFKTILEEVAIDQKAV